MTAAAAALDDIPAPPCARLLGWKILAARPKEGWIKVGFDARWEFTNPAGYIQGGFLAAMLDDTMGPAVFNMSEGPAVLADHRHACELPGSPPACCQRTVSNGPKKLPRSRGRGPRSGGGRAGVLTLAHGPAPLRQLRCHLPGRWKF